MKFFVEGPRKVVGIRKTDLIGDLGDAHFGALE